MSSQKTLPFTPDSDGEGIHFQEGSDGSMAQVVVSKGGDKNKASAPATTTAAISAATAEPILAEDPKRVTAYIRNTHATKAARLIGAASEAGGYVLAALTTVELRGGGAVLAYCEDGSATALTFYVFENRVAT